MKNWKKNSQFSVLSSQLFLRSFQLLLMSHQKGSVLNGTKIRKKFLITKGLEKKKSKSHAEFIRFSQTAVEADDPFGLRPGELAESSRWAQATGYNFFFCRAPEVRWKRLTFNKEAYPSKKFIYLLALLRGVIKDGSKSAASPPVTICRPFWP